MIINQNNPYAAMAVRSSAASPAASPTPAGQISGFNILSGIQSTAPNGKSFGIFRIDGGTSLAGMALSNEDASATPSIQDQQSDQSMLSAFKQMAAYFGQTVTAENTTLEGTAAVDLSI